MQQAMSMPPGAAGAVPPPAGITTEQIQKVRSAPPLLSARVRDTLPPAIDSTKHLNFSVAV